MSHDGKLIDDDEDIAAWLRCHLRKWRGIKFRLIEAGKIYVEDGFLRNFRCDKEASSALNYIETCSKGGEKSGETRRSKSTKTTACDEVNFPNSANITTTYHLSPTTKKEEVS